MLVKRRNLLNKFIILPSFKGSKLNFFGIDMEPSEGRRS